MVSLIGRKIPTTGVQGFQAGGLGDVFDRLTATIADPLTPAIKREQLMGLNRQNVSIQDLMQAAREGRLADPNSVAAAIGGGMESKNLGGFNLFQAANKYGAEAPETSTAAVGAQIPIQHTAAGMKADLENRLQQIKAQEATKIAVDENKLLPIVSPEGPVYTRQSAAVGQRIPQKIEPLEIASELRANPTKYGFTGPEDPRLQEAISKRIAGGGVTIDQRAEGAFASTFEKKQAEEANATLEGGMKATDTVHRLNQIETLLSKVQSGQFAPAGAKIGKIAQGLGLDPATIGINPDLPATADAIQSIVGPLLGQMVGTGPGAIIPANTFSEQDRKFLERILPALQNTPGGNTIIIDVLRRKAMRERERADSLRTAILDARRQGRTFTSSDLLAFNAGWADKVKDEQLFGDDAVKAAHLLPGASSAPTPAEVPQASVPTTPTPRSGLQGTTPNGNSWRLIH